MSQRAKDNSEVECTNSLAKFHPVLWMAAILISSGLLHLGWMFLKGADWQGPLSLRKPALFGISAGLTAWSIAWVMTKLHPHRLDRLFASAMASGLLVEVGLITVQQWRGVPSHFNHATTLDTSIEAIMLGLILFVAVGIVWLSWRSIRLPLMDDSCAIAIRGGLWLLSVSCALGIVLSVLGEINIAQGRPPETWGTAGVLKYPHGAALHAIQSLPLLYWLLNKLQLAKQAWIIRGAVGSQILLLSHACWQTFQGRSRFDFDFVGGTLCIVAGLLLIAPAVVIINASVRAFLSSKFCRNIAAAKTIEV